MVNLNDPRRADARGWGKMWSPNAARRTDMIELVVEGVSFVGGVHPEIHDLMEILLLEDVAQGYVFDRTPTQNWGFAWRAIRGSTSTPTNHSAGIAIDKNSAHNGLGRTDGGDIPPEMVRRWNRYGFRWGGDYSGREDPMHFEFMGTVADVVALTKQAEEEFMGLSPEEKAELKRMSAFLDAVTAPLKPGKDSATAAGAGDRVARATLAVEREPMGDLDGIEH